MGCGQSRPSKNAVAPEPEKVASQDVEEKPALIVETETVKMKPQSAPHNNETKTRRANEKKGVAFEISIDELKVPSNQPLSASESHAANENLKEELKEKEDIADRNRQREMEKIKQKAHERDGKAEKVLERRKTTEAVSTKSEADTIKQLLEKKNSKSKLPRSKLTA